MSIEMLLDSVARVCDQLLLKMELISTVRTTAATHAPLYTLL